MRKGLAYIFTPSLTYSICELFNTFQGKVKKPRSTKFTHVIDSENTMAVSQKAVTLTMKSVHESETDLDEVSTAISTVSSSTVQSTTSTQPRYKSTSKIKDE